MEYFIDLDKKNFVNDDWGGLVLVTGQFLILPSYLKKCWSLQSVQKKLENIDLASLLVKICHTLKFAHTNWRCTDLDKLNFAKLVYDTIWF